MGEKGYKFYIVLSGSVGVYINLPKDNQIIEKKKFNPIS